MKPLVDPANAYAAWLHRKHTKRAIVLLHGFTNNPRQFAVLGPELRADGYNVIAPRFPYHGYRDRMTDALARMRAADVLGLSLAGTVCAWLAQRVAIGQAVAIAPFFGIRDLNGPANDALTAAIDVLPNAFVWWDPVHRETQLPLHAYPRFATHALAESLSIGEAVRRRGGPLRAQRLQFVLNPGDPIVNNALAERCAATLERGGAAIEVIRASGFPPRHDVIEPTLPDPPMRSVYPFIRDLLAAGAR